MCFGEAGAILGKWVHFPTGETLMTVREPWGIILIALGGIWLSWAVRYIAKILRNAVLFIHSCRYIGWQATINRSDQPKAFATESDALLPRPRDRYQHLAKVLKEKHGVRDLLEELRKNKTLSVEERIWLFLFALLVALVWLSMLFGGYSFAKMKLDGLARLSSDRCGLWVFDGEMRSGAGTRARLWDLEKEERAARFAADCYGKRSKSPASPCNQLYRPNLPLSQAKYSNDCPFGNQICRYNQSVTFETGVIDSSNLGINSPKTPKFRHSTTCTPLSMEYPYIQNTTINGTTTYYYYYGEKPGADIPSNYTYRTVGNPWERLAPAYDVFTFVSHVNESGNAVWVPREELTLPSYSTLTIIFVSSLRILYKERSDDAIFPADMPWFIPGDPRPWFRNSDPRARPLACINTIEACTDDLRACWNVRSPSNSSIDDTSREFTFMYASLYKADIYYAIAKRQGRGLLAQNLVSQYFSEGLGDDPWVAEVQNLVSTALARAQVNAWSVASGEDSIHEGRDGYISLTDGYGDLCGMFKYNPQGYHTLLFVPLIIVACALPGLWILSWDWHPIRKKTLNLFNEASDFVKTSFLGTIVSTPGSRQALGVQDLAQTSLHPASDSTGPAEATETDDCRRSSHLPNVAHEANAPATSVSDSCSVGIGSYGTFAAAPGIRTPGERLDDGSRQLVTLQSGRDAHSQADSAAPGCHLGSEEIAWEPLLWLGLLQLLWLVVARTKDLFVSVITINTKSAMKRIGLASRAPETTGAN
ncbi:hypothetical protein K458DRAFT_431541 [Lentithecium fluviatile CBS 122367]|uniref:Uncharacterized protein n=1 Tax=Lentithecium fluviatile CBS 122367 TaxID=1168545 RepID=A0A6G1J2A3_9PLEO|nr:hypothetical protein K458DRAFT_431541 [Lentithecium fluviatile CBS 122367]